MAAGDGSAGAVPTFSFTASEAGTSGMIPELETESANGATTGEGLPPMVERVCGDLENSEISHYGFLKFQIGCIPRLFSCDIFLMCKTML